MRVAWSFFQARTSTYDLETLVNWAKNTAFSISCSKKLCEYKQRTKCLALILSKLGANKSLFWLWILEHALSSVFRCILQLSFISKERGVFETIRSSSLPSSSLDTLFSSWMTLKKSMMDLSDILVSRKDRCVGIYFIVRACVSRTINNVFGTSLLWDIAFLNCCTLAKQHCIV